MSGSISAALRLHTRIDKATFCPVLSRSARAAKLVIVFNIEFPTGFMLAFKLKKSCKNPGPTFNPTAQSAFFLCS
jgi:hypothetical protein